METGIDELIVKISLAALLFTGAAIIPYRRWRRWKFLQHIWSTLPHRGNLTTAEVVALVIENKRYRKVTDDEVLDGLWRLNIDGHIGKVPTWSGDPERWERRRRCW